MLVTTGDEKMSMCEQGFEVELRVSQSHRAYTAVKAYQHLKEDIHLTGRVACAEALNYYTRDDCAVSWCIHRLVRTNICLLQPPQ